MSTGRDELDIAIGHAVSALDAAIIENRLHDDPLRHVLVGLIQTLRAQQRLHATANQDMAGHLEQARVYLEAARQPVRDEDMQRAVIHGVSAHAISLVHAIKLGTTAGLAAVGAVLGLIGFGLGGWWQYDRMAAETAAANQIMVEAHELGNVAMSARSAALWVELIRMNPDVAASFQNCQLIPQPSGSACALPVWTMLPPPKTATPGTH